MTDSMCPEFPVLDAHKELFMALSAAKVETPAPSTRASQAYSRICEVGEGTV